MRSRAALTACFLSALTATASSQRDTSAQAVRVSNALAKVIRGKPHRDRDGVKLLDELARLHPKLAPAARKRALRAIARVFHARRKPGETTLFLAAGAVLSRLGRPGADALARAIELKRWRNKRPWGELRAQLVRQLGRAASEDHVEKLLDLALTDNAPAVRGAAGGALGSYARSTQAVRKRIVGKLVPQLAATWSSWKSRGDPTDPMIPEFKRRYEAIADPWNGALKKLTGQAIRSAPAWVRWWNEHKRGNWDRRR